MNTTMEADPTKAYNQDDVTGFIRLNALRLKVAAKVHGKKSIMFWKQKSSPVESCGSALYEALARALTQNDRIRVEDLISAAGAITGEAIIGAAGDFNPRVHDYPPGSRVLSTKVNGLFCGDKDFDEAPVDSVIGILSDKLTKGGFAKADFPVLKDIFTYFVANIGKAEEWGKASGCLFQRKIIHLSCLFAQPMKPAR